MANGDDNGATNGQREGEDAGGAQVIGAATGGAIGAAPVRWPRRSPKDRDKAGHKLRRNGLTVAKRARFLAVLSDTSSIRSAARAAEADPSAFHYLRDRDADFAAAWETALGHGREDVVSGMLSQARGTADPDDRSDPALGMTLLKHLDATAAGRGRGGRVRAAQVPLHVVHQEILRRLALVARRLKVIDAPREGQ